jgi:hypothetical protein
MEPVRVVVKQFYCYDCAKFVKSIWTSARNKFKYFETILLFCFTFKIPVIS